MKRNSIYTMLAAAVIAIVFSACTHTPEPESLYIHENQISDATSDGRVYTLNGLVDSFMTEQGNYLSDTTLYRTRANNNAILPNIWLFSIDTLPSTGEGIYIRGRVTTSDMGGNFYKSLVIQQIVGGKQQNLRISIDQGSASGAYPLGQEILIRCNGLAIGRYANQIQLCVPSYNNNTLAQNAEQKVGWQPGRIPAPLFRKAVRLVGVANQSKLVYDTVQVNDFRSWFDAGAMSMTDIVRKARREDGRLVVIKNIHFTGQLDNNGTLEYCDQANPDSSGSANVFAPTTNNIGYPQSRVFADLSGKTMMISTSEYAKFAHFYLPYVKSGNSLDYAAYVGSVRGVLGFYVDNANKLPTWTAWAITMRNIGINEDLKDLDLYRQGDEHAGEPALVPWVPVEYGYRNEK